MLGLSYKEHFGINNKEPTIKSSFKVKNCTPHHSSGSRGVIWQIRKIFDIFYRSYSLNTADNYNLKNINLLDPKSRTFTNMF